MIPNGAIVSVYGKADLATVKIIEDLAEKGCCIVPVSSESHNLGDGFSISEYCVEEDWCLNLGSPSIKYEILEEQRKKGPSLVLFTSGSSGVPKASLHDLRPMINKWATMAKHPGRKIMSFLPFDHIGGFNTVMSTLVTGGEVIAPKERTVDCICRAIAEHAVEVLPTTPTFLRMLLMTEAHQKYDLSSLQMITYGTEPMGEGILERLVAAYPGVKFKQTYGLSEVGILRTQSHSNSSTLMKIGDPHEIRDGILWVKPTTTMIGYLNAPSPFDQDGWFNTNDMVEQHGEWLRILGRKSDIINVGGQKVYPVEIEDLLSTLSGVDDVVVYGEPNPLLGQVPFCRIKKAQDHSEGELRNRIKRLCLKLEPFKRPMRIIFTDDMTTARFKKNRKWSEHAEV